MRGAATCFGFPQPSSGSYYMCFAKVMITNNTATAAATYCSARKSMINTTPCWLSASCSGLLNHMLIINNYNFSKAHTVAP